jgi:hypothetical protein
MANLESTRTRFGIATLQTAEEARAIVVFGRLTSDEIRSAGAPQSVILATNTINCEELPIFLMSPENRS